MPAGPVPPYPAELLGSERMREVLRGWRQAYDFIVIDGTPLLPVTDSFILSTMVDLSLIVARYNVTDRHVLERCCRMLQMQNGRNKVGVVVNAVDKSSQYYRQNFDSGFHAYYRTTQNA
jgi:Mrp family chromosome partitioning ATPase